MTHRCIDSCHRLPKTPRQSLGYREGCPSQSCLCWARFCTWIGPDAPDSFKTLLRGRVMNSFSDKNVGVVGGATSTADATLVPGTVTETIEVIAPAVSLQTEQPEIGTTINETLTQDLPQLVSGQVRQIDNFIFLTPGVTGNGF